MEGVALGETRNERVARQGPKWQTRFQEGSIMRYPAVALVAVALGLACGSETEPQIGDHAQLQVESAGLLDRATVSPE